ncbi:hypothetical protein [Salirhabdus salicampi]|uniref:hypothetical protein n=1 Tax=Salirhabdus salicampi TaxID=476102 RepID=UPI0020C27932|nr:hypothetical protein [Salirhabdus salicampi]MCP8616861.1 hypothetical protein [Salirhabdus salicampi]
MKRKSLYISISIVIILFFTLFLFSQEEQNVIKYFPLDESRDFIEQSTNLQLLTEVDEDRYKVIWRVHSKLDEPAYLRQDVSLLFVDGKLKGLLNKWKEEENELEQEGIFTGEGSSHIEAVTFHHGEIHYPDDLIKSVQEMTYDQIYVIDSPLSPIDSFKRPESTSQKEWKKTLDHAVNQQLTYYWNRWITHYNVSKEDYIQIPLVQLPQYEEKSLPTLSQNQTHQVIGQLWEGLYKNIVTNFKIAKENNKPFQTYMPLVLVDKKGSHLLVLYEENGQIQKLIQRIPNF